METTLVAERSSLRRELWDVKATQQHRLKMELATQTEQAHGGATETCNGRNKMNLAGSLLTAGFLSTVAFSALPLSMANAQDTGKKVILSPNAPNPIGPYS